MFTGLVQAKAKVLGVSQPPIQSTLASLGGCKLEIASPESFLGLRTGDSVAVNGICLTLVEPPVSGAGTLRFELGAETLRILRVQASTLPWSWQGSEANLEKPMVLGDHLHGHLVSGHVDTCVEVCEVQSSPEVGWRLTVKVSAPWKKYLWPKCSVTLQGVSLTVNSVTEHKNNEVSFQVGLIPETLQKTNLSQARPGDFLTIEFDWMAKLFENFLKNNPLLSPHVAQEAAGTSNTDRGVQVDL